MRSIPPQVFKVLIKGNFSTLLMQIATLFLKSFCTSKQYNMEKIKMVEEFTCL
jgi:hypothetical protein